MTHKKLFTIIIDDDPDDLAWLQEALEGTSAFDDIKSCAGGTQAFDLLDNPGRNPDIIITDLKMPVVTGFDILKKIKITDKLSNIPIMVFSTSSNSLDIEKARSLGAVAFITKPYTLQGFMEISQFILNFLRGGVKKEYDTNKGITLFGI